MLAGKLKKNSLRNSLIIMNNKLPKIKIIKTNYDSTGNIFRFSLLDCVVKPNGEIDHKLIKKMKENGIIESMKNNLKNNYNGKSKIRRYTILLDNNLWIEGKVIGEGS